MELTLSALLHMLLFPGGVFALGAGLLLKGVDRRVQARLQRRVGPPLLQPFLDLAKLAAKETLVPETANRTAFLAAPLIGLTGMAVAAALIPVPGAYSGMPEMGDMLVLFYLLPLPAIALMVGGSASSSPFGALGFSREMGLMLAYEIPLLAVLLAVAMKAGAAVGAGPALSLTVVVGHQMAAGQFGFSPAMLPALAAYLLFLPGTLGVPPFDVPEAESEIVEGPLLEYSGPALGFFHLASALKTMVVLGLGVDMFFPTPLPGGALVNVCWFLAKCLALMLVSLTVARAATGRFRPDQAFTFFLKYPAPLALASLALAWMGF
ncbi:MAG: NADH-quinone oxidoreductase subunit H [Desulfovibrionaceae bacterium]|jgi:NADH-quinone oxidoreductase subunit H|nr:NADH-quinone oxidoreductase subunit H [Desulfovibrionaceae bacterium]